MGKPIWMIGRSSKGMRYMSKPCPICGKWKYDYTIYDGREICIQCANQLGRDKIRLNDPKSINRLIDEILELAKECNIRTRLKKVESLEGGPNDLHKEKREKIARGRKS